MPSKRKVWEFWRSTGLLWDLEDRKNPAEILGWKLIIVTAETVNSGAALTWVLRAWGRNREKGEGIFYVRRYVWIENH
jgi:hypothetical protein